MKRLKLLFALACLSLSSLASAGVLYQWNVASVSTEIRNVTGFIELRDGAAGHIDYSLPPCNSTPCNHADPLSPILRIGMMFNDLWDGAIDIDVLAGTGFVLDDPKFDLAFTIDGNRLTHLNLMINTLFSTLRIDEGNIVFYASDSDNCYLGCSGSSGQFARPAVVPAPASMALLALAGVALAYVRRRPAARLK